MKKSFYVVAFLMILLVNLYSIDQKAEYKYYDHRSDLALYDLDSYTFKKDDVLEQKIIAKDDNFSKLNIIVYVGNINIESHLSGCVTVGIKDSSGNVIAEYQYERVFFQNQVKLGFEFPTQKYSKGKEYTLYLKSFKDANFTLQTAKNNNNSELLRINGKSYEDSLILETYYLEGISNNLYIFYICITVIFVFLMIVLNKYKLMIHNKYLLIAIILSFLSICLTPFFQGQDEVYHFYRIYEISEGNIVTDEIDGWPGYYVPKTLTHMRFSKYSEIKNKFVKVDDEKLENANMEFMAVYSPVSYLPQTIGISLAKLICDYPLIWAYGARVFQAIFCITCVYFAIKIIPFAKSAIFMIAMLPTFLEATTLMSTDGIVVSTSLLLIAKILQIVYEKKKVDKKDWILLTILSIFVAIAKLVFFPIIGLLFLIPMHLKNVKKRYIIGIIALSLLIMVGWNLVAMSNLVGGQGVNAVYLIKYFLFHPLEFVQIFINTFASEAGNYVSDLAGGKNGVFEATIHDARILPQIFMLCYMTFIFKGENKLNKKDKYVVLACLLSTCALIYFSLLISCTPVYSTMIRGVQGRYFLATLSLVYLFFANSKKEYKEFDFNMIIPLIYLMYFLTNFMGYA